jgi:hypothetical protein
MLHGYLSIYQAPPNHNVASPVILEDEETNTPSIEAPAVFPSLDAAVESTAELNQPTGPPNQEA